jgi:hypothetical protein
MIDRLIAHLRDETVEGGPPVGASGASAKPRRKAARAKRVSS